MLLHRQQGSIQFTSHAACLLPASGSCPAGRSSGISRRPSLLPPIFAFLLCLRPDTHLRSHANNNNMSGTESGKPISEVSALQPASAPAPARSTLAPPDLAVAGLARLPRPTAALPPAAADRARPLSKVPLPLTRRPFLPSALRSASARPLAPPLSGRLRHGRPPRRRRLR